MPRGNDTQEAVQELAQRFQVAGNAEDLIRANRLRRSSGVSRAGLTPVDRDATKELDREKVQKAVGDDANVLDAAVHGNQVLYVAETTDEDPTKRRTFKGVLERKGKADFEHGEEKVTAAEAEIVAEAEEARVAREAREREQREVTEVTDRAREKARESSEKDTQKAREDARERARKAAGESQPAKQ